MRHKVTCLACANSHRNCDQQKPVCGRCSRSGRLCIYNTIDPAYIRPRSSCLSCANLHQKCDKQKPVCGRCNRLGKICTYNTTDNDDNHQQHIEPDIDHTNEPDDLLRYKIDNATNTMERIIQKIQEEYNTPKSHKSITSIILSSSMNRKTIMDFIKGSPFKNQAKTHVDKHNFCIHQYTKKQILEILW